MLIADFDSLLKRVAAGLPFEPKIEELSSAARRLLPDVLALLGRAKGELNWELFGLHADDTAALLSDEVRNREEYVARIAERYVREVDDYECMILCNRIIEDLKRARRRLP